MEMVDFVEESEEACVAARTAVARKRRRHTDQDRKVARAALVMLGELSSARRVLEGCDLAWQLEHFESAHKSEESSTSSP